MAIQNGNAVLDANYPQVVSYPDAVGKVMITDTGARKVGSDGVVLTVKGINMWNNNRVASDLFYENGERAGGILAEFDDDGTPQWIEL